MRIRNMKHIHLSPIFGLLPLIGLGGCGMLGGDRTPEVTNAARLNVAMAAEAAGDNQMALQIYATAMARDPNDVRAAVQYARALVNNRQVGLARELLSRQLASHPGQPDLSREFGTIEVLQGQAASALPRFDVALAANPNDVKALVNKGIALDMLGQHAEAQALYGRADVIAPDDPTVRSNLAMSLMLSGRSSEAGQVMQGVASTAADVPRIRNNMAVVAAANGDMSRARQLSAGEVSDAELQSLATQLRNMPQTAPVPVSAAPAAPAPIARAPEAVAPLPVSAASATTPVTIQPADTAGTGALPLAVPGPQESAAPAQSPTRAATPPRAQDKRSAGRLNMTAVTPAEVARALEQAIEKEAAFIGAAPTASASPTLSEGARILPAIAASPLRLHRANVGVPVTAVEPARILPAPQHAEGPRVGYSVQLAAVGSQSGAQQEWVRINNRVPFLLMGREATMDRGQHADGREYWRLRTSGFAAFGAAREFCDALKLAGQDCFVTGGRAQHAAARPVAAPVPETGASPAAAAAQSPEG